MTMSDTAAASEVVLRALRFFEHERVRKLNWYQKNLEREREKARVKASSRRSQMIEDLIRAHGFYPGRLYQKSADRLGLLLDSQGRWVFPPGDPRWAFPHGSPRVDPPRSDPVADAPQV